MFSLKRWLQSKEAPHVGPSIWEDIYPRIFATLFIMWAWWGVSGWFLATANPEDLLWIQRRGSIFMGLLIFFGAGEQGFGN